MGNSKATNIKKPQRVLLFSTITELAYSIDRKFYNGVHFVWCTETFDANVQPRSSNPKTLCARYIEQLITEDKHASEINNNKAGILKGAKAKLEQGATTKEQFEDIKTLVRYARKEDFYPIIMLINRNAVIKKQKLHVVSADKAASKNSIEYIIYDLQHNEFEAIHLRDVLSGAITLSDDWEG